MGRTSPHARIGGIRRGPDDASQENQARRRSDYRDEKTPPLTAAYDSGEEPFLGTCNCRGAGEWKTTRTAFLCKRRDARDIGNYRPICLLSAAYNLFTRVTLNGINKTPDEVHPYEQPFIVFFGRV
ncbi:unnamed protein product [Heligmosomoides polygyrus]|uniref:Uncharacterized protein n=1 Tax=Heligmosomoides polygyrus TaxID=6339 RepID=A0A183F5D1_HELPZ|nr:unnamed protein product [Heligmosomoides polygyrus]